LKSLDQIGKNNEEEQEILNLWRGYVYRNLGRVYDILNNKDRAKETLKKAFDSRNNVIKHMSLGMPDIINSQLELETSLAELDILECDPKDKENEIKIKRICEKLKERKPTIRPIVVWSIAIDQAIELVKKHKFDNCKEILKKLNVLKRTLTYGFPWEKNRT
jgi:tetratricopeptide (TPR) repeat protein